MNPMKKTTLLLVSVSAALAAQSSVFAGLAGHISEENADITNSVPLPVDPVDASQGYDWGFDGSQWEIEFPATQDGLTITAMFDGPITIGALNFRRFGLDNVFVETNMKTFTVEFDYVGGQPRAVDPDGGGAREGVHPARGYDGVPTSTFVSETDVDGHYTYIETIRPQPDWEFVTIWNMHVSHPMTITNVKLTSVCAPIPTPSTAALLGISALGTLSRRRR